MEPGSRTLPSSGVAFEPTSTARLEETMRELSEFAPHVKTARDGALAHAAALEAHAARLHAAMSVPLPRVWSPVAGSPSQCEPGKPAQTHDYTSGRVGGGTVDERAFAAAAAEVPRQLRVAVAAPLERWLDALDVAAARLRSVERARLGLDGARRQAEEAFARDEAKAHAAFAALRDPTAAAVGASGGGGGDSGLGAGVFGGGAAAAAGDSQYGRGFFGRRRARRAHGAGGGGGGALDLFSGSGASASAVSAAVGPSSLRGALFVEQARAAELEEAALRRAQHERALGAIRASFEEQERLAFEMLGGLARDTARLKTYLAAALLAAMHGSQRLALSLGAAKLPLPGGGGPAPGGGGGGVAAEYGRIGPVDDELLAASPLARELARGRLPPSAAEAEVGAAGAATAGGAAPGAARRPWPVVVRRAVATPMAVGADTMLQGRAPVPQPTATGGAGQEWEAEQGPSSAAGRVPLAAGAGGGGAPGLLPTQQQQMQQRPALEAGTDAGGGAAYGAEAGAPAGAAATALLRHQHQRQQQQQQQQPGYGEPTAATAARAGGAAAAGGAGVEDEEDEDAAFDEARSRQTWTPRSSVGSYAKEQPMAGRDAATGAMRTELA